MVSYGTVMDSDGECGTVVDSDSECETVPDSDGECGTVLDSTSQHSMYSMVFYERYNKI
jgi:hypothetical protein